MMRTIRSLFTAALASAILSSASAQDATATVTVKIAGLKGKEGVALVTLYDSAETWLKVPKAIQVSKQQITGDELTVTFKAVRPGTYAVSVIHDENKNNELDMRWFPFPRPKEGSGASNNPEPKRGPAKWEDTKFTVAAEGVTLKVSLRYYD